MTTSYALVFILHFYVSRYWVFRAGAKIDSHIKEFIAVGVITFIGLGINLILLSLLHEFLTLSLYLSGTIAILISVVWNYIARRKWVYQV